MLQSWYIREYEEQSQNARHFGTDHYFFPCWGRGWRFCFWADNPINTSIEFKRTRDKEKLFQVIVLNDFTTLLLYYFTTFCWSLYSPTSTRQCCDVKNAVIHSVKGKKKNSTTCTLNGIPMETKPARVYQVFLRGATRPSSVRLFLWWLSSASYSYSCWESGVDVIRAGQWGDIVNS